MAEVRTDDGKDVYVDQAFLNLPASHSAEAAAPLVPKEPGLYTLGSGDSKLQRIEGRVTSFERSGSRLASAATVGIHAARTNTQIPGEHAHVTLSPTPGFYFRTDSRSEVEEEGLDLVLTRMTVKHGRRQFEVAAQGIWRSSKGISVRHQIDFDASEVEAGLYRIVPAQKLQEGQYAFYMLRGEEHASVMAGRGFVYDFQVE
ncbi:MAG TPA: hypothetical protein VG206_07810 [Terriglobia bacterium]|nr:hypothetical protein [Terriglobia bacterium]